MNTRRLLVAVANVLLAGSVGVSTWRAYHAEVLAARQAAALEHAAEVSTSWTAFFRFPGTVGIYFVLAMFSVTALAFAGLALAARRRPDWLTLPQKAAFAALSPDQRSAVVTTVQDYLLVVATLCVSLVAFVAWHALGASTGAWPVPFGGDTRLAALVSLVVIIPFLAASTVLFHREFQRRVDEARQVSPGTGENRPAHGEHGGDEIDP